MTSRKTAKLLTPAARTRRKMTRRKTPKLLALDGLFTPPLGARDGISKHELAATAATLAKRAPELFARDAGRADARAGENFASSANMGATAPARGVRKTSNATPAAGFLQLPWRTHALREITRTAERMKRGVRDVVQVGLGGSSLGAQVLMRALAHPLHNQLPHAHRRAPRVHFLDNADPASLAALLDVLDPRHTLLHVVSKSGGTLESAALFQALQPVLARALGAEGWQRRCVFTTGVGVLREYGEKCGATLLDFPTDVGGRYSVLSASGLFVPALAGVDVAGVVRGARNFLRGTAGTGAQHPSARAAAAAFLLDTRRGKNIIALMPYADALEPLARWYVQLCAESLGKVRRTRARHEHVGPTPLAARGSTDQHSQLQLFTEGPPSKLVMFVTARRLHASAKLKGGATAPHLKGRTLAQVMHASHAATELALAEAGRPSLTWTLPAITPAAVGALLVALELMTVGQGLLYGINPYDQPGVEFAKRAAKKLLARS